MELNNIDFDKKITELLNTLAKSPVIVGIDGKCGGGKTTLANALANTYACHIISMDDFFLRQEQRNAQRMQEIGGNIDYERFIEQVVIPIREHKNMLKYNRFNCQSQTFVEVIKVPLRDLVVVEGTYSLHKLFRDMYDIKIFVDIPYEQQIERLSQRESEEKLAMFIEKWIPLEEKYFFGMDVRKHSDFVIGNNT
ncbi:MAG: hypothetical protein ATN35_02990 [Epulopiscium sp. Nele67-Bin004]|nr:MAG: hypothetical protein ATN35_02990 [Epulopiscium sp. Nele67-Bin004]